ncbi:Uncharacterized conserved protein, DUF58 family, contains vWF domain [Halovenus aranensis]|uniref:Uncharacterized conserved protein, DUF58 family, contains vWF domain n=1 Tax=Halovenus aranensis TaxID=890420 RepID=A0A1G8Z8L2_9EURY|nr:DUF58 domain-containing protein [Halovenus aranensis]SDK11412.1 Uncharacterized conserved protein, DUF58 family, contains vWF domain [Halovenus aranensis]
MEATRRLWGVAALAVVLGLSAAVLGRLLPLLGTVLVGVWILSRQYLFYRASTTLVSGLTVRQRPARTLVRTDETAAVTLTATVSRPTALACTIRAGVPTAASAGEQPRLALEPGETTTETTVDVEWPVAGRHEFQQATLTVGDGLFEQTVPVGEPATVTVQPRGPRNVHVGEGGDQALLAYGEHAADHPGSGVEPAELREYTAGDAADRIDWNATARLNTPYIREYEAETDQETLLVVDHRSPLSTGPPAETKLAYLREVALALVDSAKQLDDPLGMVSVGDDGITAQFGPTTTPSQYDALRRTLLSLEPTTGRPTGTDRTAGRSKVSSVRQRMEGVGKSLSALKTDEGEFGDTLRPFYDSQQQYRTLLEDRPLVGAVRTALARRTGQQVTLICTDDSNPLELRETATLAAQNGGQVLLLLAPTVLYETATVEELEARYEQYVTFEQFRRELSRLDRVTALEVGPGDRLTAVLAGGGRPSPTGGERA